MFKYIKIKNFYTVKDQEQGQNKLRMGEGILQ